MPPAKMNPFPGLRPFTQEEDYLFFGREEQTIELLQRLGGNRFVAVVGTSGSGKSSLVRCGLLSQLLGGKMLGAGASWEIAVTHPGGNPLALLTDALLEADLYDRDEEHARENLLATLSRSHFGLVEAVKQADLGQGTNFLLVVDQFEEIFRFHEAGQTQQEVANEFVSLLLEAAAQKEVPIYVVLTMRSDFIGECGQFEGLAEMVNRGEFLIPRLTREQYKRVIEGPIKVAGGQIAPRLLQRLLNDLGQQADQLPCLQHALMRTWNVWAGNGDAKALDLDDYQRVGKMSQALSLHADEIYQSLASDRQRELCQGIFQALTVEESNNRGIRRPQRLGRLCQILEVSADELLPIIDAYRQSGVTFLMPSPDVELTDQTIIDISHESLMRVWTRLRQWVEEETQAAGIYHRLSESAALNEQGKAGLYRDPELGIALAWRESTRPNAAWAERYRPGFATAIGFLEASQQASVAEEQAREAARQRELEQAQRLAEAQQLRLEQQHRAARKLRRLIAGLAVVALIAGVACVAALIANNRANTLAEVAGREAVSAQHHAAEAERERETAQQAQRATQQALTEVEAEKSRAESNLRKAVAAEKGAQRAERRSREFRYATDMQLAARLIGDEHANAAQVLARLADYDPAKNQDLKGKDDLRGFEWYCLKRLMVGPAAIFPGGDQPVIESTVTPEGELVTLDDDARLRRWDPKTRRETRPPLELKKGRYLGSKALSVDGRRVALAIENKVHMVDTATGEEIIPAIPAQARFGMIFSPDNRMLVTVGATIGWWNAVTGQPIAAQESKLDVTGPVSISSDGLTLAVGRQTGTYSAASFSVFRLNPDARKVTVLLDKHAANMGTTRAVALSPDGSGLAVSQFFSGDVALFDTSTGRMSRRGFDHAASVSAIGFNPQGNEMVTASLDGSIKVWTDYQGRQSTKTTPPATTALMGHTEEVTRVAFAPGGKQLISTSRDQTTRIWDLAQKTASLHRTVEVSMAYRARYSPDGLLIAAAEASAQGNVRLRDAATGRLLRELPGSNRVYPDSVAFSPDNRWLAVGTGGMKDLSHVELWDIDRGEPVAVLPGTTAIPNFSTTAVNGIVGALCFSPDGKFLVAGFGSLNSLPAGKIGPHPIKVYDVATRRAIRLLEGHENYCTSVAFSSDASRMASGSYDGTARIWDTSTWKTLHVLQNPDPLTPNGNKRILDVAFSPAADLVAMASHEGNVHVWNAATGEHLQTLKGHANGVSSVVFSPDGRTLASGSYDKTIRLWNVATWREVMRLNPGVAFVPKALAFSPDGRQLLGAGNRAILWSTRPDDESQAGQLAQQLAALLDAKFDFTSRIRMFSENVGLHEALEVLERQRPGDTRVQAALAAARANRHALRREWRQAAQAFGQLKTIPPHKPGAWFRTPGLLRLAAALLHENRPADAADLLTGGAKRRTQDGLPAAVDRVGVGFAYSAADGAVRVTELLPGFLGPRAGLLLGDTIVKVNDTELTKQAIPKLGELLVGDAGTKVRLTVRHSGSERPEVIGLTRERFVHDAATGELLHSLRATINERLAREPRNARLLELRAEFAGQWSDTKAQAADYTAAIEALSKQTTKATTVALKRLYGRRGNAYIGSRQWQQAVDDYARIVTDATTDDVLLSNQALALAEALLSSEKWTALKPVEAKSELGATLSILPDDSILASGANPLKDRYRVVLTVGKNIELAAVRLEALTHPSLPGNGPGRNPVGTFAQISWKVTARSPDRKDPIMIEFDNAWADQQLKEHPINSNGHWNIYGGHGGNCTAIWSMSNRVSLAAGTTLTFEMQCHNSSNTAENLGHFRLSVSSDPAALDRERRHFAVAKLTDPWQKLARAYQIRGDQQALDQLVKRRPKSAGQIGDVFTQGKDEDKDWRRAMEIYSKGLAADATDVVLLSKRARAYEALKNWDAAAADWSRAVTGNPDGAKLLADFAQRLAAAGQVPLANGQFAKAQALYERSLGAEPENDLVATELAQLLLDKHDNGNSTRWTVLKPTEIKSTGGTTLTLQSDWSILASGASPDQETYTVMAKPALASITVVRLETLPHPSLPEGGSGRDPNGSFLLSEFTVKRTQPGEPTAQDPLPLRIHNAVASFYRDSKSGFERASDGQLKTYWDPWPEVYRRQEAVFELQPNPKNMTASNLVVQLTSNGQAGWPRTLGCFRLSVSDDPAAFEREQKRVALLKFTDPWLKLAAAYAVNGRKDEAAQYFGKALQRADGYEARKPIMELAARFDYLFSALVQRQPDDLQVQLALARKLAERGQQRLLEKQPAEALAELQKSRDVFTRLRAELQWKVLTPTDLKSNGGEKLTVESDGSIFVSGPNPDRAVYTLKLRTDLPVLTALRLETIPDARLPDGGAGRYGNGNFHVSEFTAAIVSAQADAKPTAIDFGSAIADWQDSENTSKNMIDGNPQTRWDTHPNMREAHWAVFGLKSPARVDGGYLSITLDSGIAPWRQHGLGRFRLSVTNEAEAEALMRAALRNDLKDSEVVDLSVALAKAHAQQGHINEAVASFTEALDLATDRAGKARIITEAAALAGVLEKLAERAAGNAQFQAELTRHFAERGKTPLANAARTKARALFEAKLAKEPENSALAAELADLLLIDTTRWTVLKPTEMKSEGGATLSVLPDNSILASGRNPLGDAYTIVAETGATRVSAIRLEALTHESLPNQGPGRDEQRDRGNFTMTNLQIRPRDAGAKAAPIRLSEATADFAYYPVSVTYWNTGGGGSKPHTAYFRTEQPGDFAQHAKLEFRMQFSNNADWPLQNLGRFRLSVSDDPAAFEREQKRCAALKLTDPWAKLAAVYAATGQNEGAVHYFSKALEGADGYEAKKAIVEPVVSFDKILDSLVKRYPTEPQLQLALARNLAARGKTALAAKKPADALAQLKQARDIFTRLLAPREAWTVLTPVEMKTENGSKLELQKDGSVFVHQPAKNDTYSLVFQTELKGINGVRLEALADSRLPGGGPGWATGDGNFVLSELSLQATPAKSPDQPRSIALRNPWADFSQVGYDVRAAVDGNGTTGWAVLPEFNKDHTAVFETAEEIGDGRETRLTVRLSHQYTAERFLLGRFRLSFTNGAATLQATRIRLDLKDSEVVDASVALAKAYAQQGHINEAAASFAEAFDLAADRAGKAKIITEAAALEGVLEKLAQRAAGHARLQSELARHFAEVAYGHKKFAAATQRWAEALASDPKLGDDRQTQHRYQAARAAALAAAGQGKDEPPLDDAAKAKLRRQALDWLKAELTARSKLFESGPPQDRPTIVQPLSDWLKDSDLAGIRNADALAKLPAEEQKAFTRLWADVAHMAELLKFEPRDVTDPKQFAALLDVVAPGFTTAAVGGSLGLLKEHFDRPVVVRTHPIIQGVPCILTRTVKLAADVKSKLRLSVAHDPRGDWQLIVKANGEKLYDGIIGPATTKNGWADLEIDLSRFAGRKVNIELHNHPNDWAWEFGYWARVEIVPEPDVGIVAVKGNAGRLAFAQFAYDRKRFAFATQLWASALASDPKLGDDRQAGHRYNAAHAAVLAAAGQGKDEPPPGDAAKAKLRRQALDWLKAELTVWTKQLASGPPQARPAIVQTLSRWQKDTDLAGIRAAAALAKLPTNERAAFAQLWADVAALLKKAQEKPK